MLTQPFWPIDWTTPLENGYSPAQLLYSRQLRTDLPITHEQRCPKVPEFSVISTKEEKQEQRQKRNFDARHKAKDLPPLSMGSKVFLPDCQESVHVNSQPACPSYVISTASGGFRSNQWNINLFYDQSSSFNYHFQHYQLNCHTTNSREASINSRATSPIIIKQFASTAPYR